MKLIVDIDFYESLNKHGEWFFLIPKKNEKYSKNPYTTDRIMYNYKIDPSCDRLILEYT